MGSTCSTVLCLTRAAIHGDKDNSNSQDRQRGPLHGRQILPKQPHSKQSCWHDLEALRTDLKSHSIKMRRCNND